MIDDDTLTTEAEEPMEISGEYSLEELVALAELFDKRTFPGLSEDLHGGLSEEARAAAIDAGRRALIARGAVWLDDDAMPVIADEEGLMVALALSPALLVTASRWEPEAALTARYSVRPELGLEQTTDTGAVWRLEVFDTDDLMQRIIDFAELSDAIEPRGDGFTTTVEALTRVDQHLDAGDREAAAAALPPEAGRFVEALVGRIATHHVVAVYGEDETTARGGDAMWVDGGDAGLWLLEPPRENGALPSVDGETRVGIRPVGAMELVDQLLSYLPPDAGVDAVG